ncbi:putative reverse transcriptase domain-containing protein [Tanacetum coccineum]
MEIKGIRSEMGMLWQELIWVAMLKRGRTLNFLNHPFNIDLMPLEMGSFDVVIGMNWLAKYHAVIVCDEKLVRVPFGDKILIFHGDGSNNGHESRLNIISYTKTQKYLLKGCPIFLAHGISNRFDTRCCAGSTGTLSTGSVRDERIVGPTKGTFRQRLFKT